MLQSFVSPEELAAESSLFKEALAHTVNRVVDICNYIVMREILQF